MDYQQLRYIFNSINSNHIFVHQTKNKYDEILYDYEQNKKALSFIYFDYDYNFGEWIYDFELKYAKYLNDAYCEIEFSNEKLKDSYLNFISIFVMFNIQIKKYDGIINHISLVKYDSDEWHYLTRTIDGVIEKYNILISDQYILKNYSINYIMSSMSNDFFILYYQK
jgi:hypothetical protein